MTRPRDEAGTVTIVLLLTMTVVFALGGLVIDAGRALTARERAANEAEQAARAGADRISEAAFRAGRLRVDPAAARRAALDYLEPTGDTGTVRVTPTAVTVTVTAHTRPAFLGLLGIRRFTVRATATARPVSGVSTIEDSP